MVDRSLVEVDLAAHTLLRRLVQQGWTPPGDLSDLVGRLVETDPHEAPLAPLEQAAVRSLSEDLAVARLRASSAREKAARTRARGSEALLVSSRLEEQYLQHHGRLAADGAAAAAGRTTGTDRAAGPAAVSGLIATAVGLETTTAVLDWALGHLPTATAADEVSIRLDGTLRVSLAGGQAEAAEQLQVELGEGPTLAASSGSEVVWAEPAGTSAWPRWSAAVAGLGVRGAVAVPLVPELGPAGALTLYVLDAATVGPEQLEAARTAGALLSLCLGHARRAQHLREAMENRTVIGQAQGLLMERYTVDADDAFAVLRRLSNTSHRPLFEVAEELIDTRLLPGAG